MASESFDKLVRRFAKLACQIFYAPQRWYGRNPSRFVFLIAHQRSGSSVLAHILFSNPEIIGYGETHILYRTEADLISLANKVHCGTRRLLLRDAWILDKIAEPTCYAPNYLPSNEKCFFVFLVREPEATIRSMVKAFPDWYRHDPRWFRDCELTQQGFQKKAIKDYTRSLQRMMAFADKIEDASRAVFVLHSELIENTAKVFDEIEKMLCLESPLKETYNLISTTGREFVGDTSPNIRKGYLDRTIASGKETINADELRQCQDVFEQCCRRLERFAVAVQ